MKKTLMMTLSLAFLLFVAACSTPIYTVTFDSQGGTEVTPVEVFEDDLLVEPTAPTRTAAGNDAYSFVGWFTNAEATTAFDFETPITENLTLYASWTLNVVLRFETKTSQTIEPLLLGEEGGNASAPATPTREGFRFGGWFRGRPGLTWLEPSAVEFPLSVEESTTLYAYWEPLDSKAVTYTADETYVSTFVATQTIILNPLTYQWSHENAYIDFMVTPMYTTEVDWDKAIDQGVADYPGDFSKIEANEFSIEALDFKYLLAGATNYPIDSNGDEHLNEDGEFDREGSSTFTDTFWTINIREDLKFEDGTPITTATFEYTLQQFLSQAQNNYRATIFYKDASNTGGAPIKNADNYFKQVDENGDSAVIPWSEVGFKIVDDYTFTIEFDEPRSQLAVTGIANNIRLLHPTAYADSLDDDGINSNYGNPSNPYVSYGPYIMKSWDANQKIVFNKNYEYVLREVVTYKSQVIEIVPDLATEYNLFKDGSTSVFGLTNDYFAEFSENPNLYFSWNGFPQYLILNTAGSRLAENGHEQPTIMFDARFRQALFFGFDRNYFNTSVYAPNTPSLLTVPLDTKAYIQDPLYYSESPNHLAVLEKFNIDPETNGYIPARAVELFNAAYTDWVAEGNTGPVVLKYVASNSTTLGVNLANYVKSSYETLFGADKLQLNIVFGDQTSTSAAQRNWDFDIALSAIGFGSSSGIQWQYPAITFLGALIGGANLGLTQPFDLSVESEDEDLDGIALYYSEEFEIDLTPTYEYLLSIEDDETTPEDFLTLLDWLKEDGDKAAGIYRGTVGELGSYLYNDTTPFDGSSSAPFPGATQEVWKMVAAFEELFLKYIPLVPTATRSSAVVYADNVVITWAKYHSGFGWGATRYRYLNTDPDFADGFYNSFAE